MLAIIFGTAFVILCLQAALRDMVTLTIPNWMNLALLALFVPAAFASGLGWTLAGLHLLTALAAFVVTFGLYAVGAFGGGDAKMIPAVLIWIGPAGVLPFLVGMAFGGGILALVLILARKYVPTPLAPPFAEKILTRNAGIPYGVAIAAGALLAMPHSPVLSEFLSLFGEFG